MKFNFVPITLEYAREIDEWHYDGKFEDLFMTPYFTSFEKDGVFKGPGGCDGFVALLDNNVSGLFEFTVSEPIMEIGLALEPGLVGKGIGVDLVNQGIEFGLKNYQSKITVIKLEVDFKNIAAIRVYEKAGFIKVKQTNDEIEMRREVD